MAMMLRRARATMDTRFALFSKVIIYLYADIFFSYHFHRHYASMLHTPTNVYFHCMNFDYRA